MPRQKCDNARSLARPVAASRSLQCEIMPTWQNCIVAARRFPLFCDSLDRSSLASTTFLLRFLIGLPAFQGEKGRGGRVEQITLGWKRGDNAADDRVCLLIREREEGRFNSIRGEQFWKTGSERGSVDRYSLRGWKIRGWSWEGNQLILIERDSTSSECFEHRRWDTRWYRVIWKVKDDV